MRTIAVMRFVVIGCVLLPSIPVFATQTVRTTRVLNGDFVVIGNSLGLECQAGVLNVGEPAPWLVPAAPVCSGTPWPDFEQWSSADRMWRLDTSVEPPAITNFNPTSGVSGPTNASSIAPLNLPVGASVVYARLYWVGSKVSSTECLDDVTMCSFTPGAPIADASAVLDSPVASGITITADSTRSIEGNTYYNAWTYQSSADVTAIVQAGGNGRYRVSDVEVESFDPGYDIPFSHAGWWLTIIYELSSEPKRQVAIADGLDRVDGGSGGSGAVQTLVVTGFRAPNAVAGKLAVITVEGDVNNTGGLDQLDYSSTGGAPYTLLSDGTVGSTGNFFNGTFSYLGVPISDVSVPTHWRNTGSFPQPSGGRGSLAGLDIDVVAISLTPAANDLTFRASTSSSISDYYTLESFVASVETIAPELETSSMTVSVDGGGSAAPGSTLTYRITVTNNGSDAGSLVSFENDLPSDVCFVPGSLTIVSGVGMGSLSDAASDDAGEFVGTTDAACATGSGGRVVVRLGSGATAVVGGSLAIAETIVVELKAVVSQSATDGAVISNQGTLHATGFSGASEQTFLTDANIATLLKETTDVTIVVAPVVVPPVVTPPVTTPVTMPATMPVEPPVDPPLVAAEPDDPALVRRLGLRGGVFGCASAGDPAWLVLWLLLPLWRSRRRK